MTVDRPVLRWHGGKFRLAPWILSFFPPHKCYVEPYGGAGSVLMLKPKLPAEVYNDLEGSVVNVFRVLRDPEQAQRLRELLELTPFARLELKAAYEATDDPVEWARRTIVLSFQGHGSDSVTRGYTTGFRGKLSNGRAMPSQSWATWPETIPAFTDRLRGVVIEQVKAIRLIRRLDGEGVLFYVDPPYLHSTRSTKGKGAKSQNRHGYKHEMSIAGHRELLKALKTVKGMVVLSGYPSPHYDRALKGWSRYETETLADGAKKRTEVLWLNPAAQRALDEQNRQLSLFAGAA